MANSASKFYSVMVVGDNPQQLMEEYRIGRNVDKYIKYKYIEANKMKDNAVDIYQSILKNKDITNLTKYQLDLINEKLNLLKNMSTFEYYKMITKGCFYDENGDAWSDVNPNGKWNTYQNGTHFSIPLVTFGGKETFTEFNKNIDWSKIHMVSSNVYEIVWDLFKNGKEPSNETEKQIYENMLCYNNDNYFNNFSSKDDYVAYNASYWNYAYLDKNGWIDVDDDKIKSKNDWIKNFYNNFIVKLKDDDKITIFEFTRNSDD